MRRRRFNLMPKGVEHEKWNPQNGAGRGLKHKAIMLIRQWGIEYSPRVRG